MCVHTPHSLGIVYVGAVLLLSRVQILVIYHLISGIGKDFVVVNLFICILGVTCLNLDRVTGNSD